MNQSDMAPGFGAIPVLPAKVVVVLVLPVAKKSRRGATCVPPMPSWSPSRGASRDEVTGSRANIVRQAVPEPEFDAVCLAQASEAGFQSSSGEVCGPIDPFAGGERRGLGPGRKNAMPFSIGGVPLPSNWSQMRLAPCISSSRQ